MDLRISDFSNMSGDEVLKSKWKLCELRFEYSWRSFEFHAKQRVSMFNFFILFTGILGTAFAHLVKAKSSLLAGSVLLIGCFICFIIVQDNF